MTLWVSSIISVCRKWLNGAQWAPMNTADIFSDLLTIHALFATLLRYATHVYFEFAFYTFYFSFGTSRKTPCKTLAHNFSAESKQIEIWQTQKLKVIEIFWVGILGISGIGGECSAWIMHEIVFVSLSNLASEISDRNLIQFAPQVRLFIAASQQRGIISLFMQYITFNIEIKYSDCSTQPFVRRQLDASLYYPSVAIRPCEFA